MSLSDNYSCEGQMSIFDVFSLDSQFTKTCQEPSQATKEKTSEPSLKKRQGSQIKMPLFLNLQKGSGHQADASWEMGGLLLGEYTMHSFGECPSEERESRLSQILVDNPHPKYSLSAKACNGILTRARRRGKKLPEQLEQALIRQSASKNEQDARGGVRESSSKTNEPHPSELNATNQSYGISGEIAGTLDASYYKGCGERAGVEREVVCLEGNGSRESHKVDGYKESETMYTLNTVEQHAVCVGNGQLAQAKLSDKVGALNCMHDQQAVMVFEPGSESRVGGHVYDDEKSGTVRANAGDNQQAVVYSTQACGDRDKPSQSFMEETAYTVPANPMSDRGQAVLAIDRASFNQGQNAQFDFSVQEELAQTIVAKGPGGGTNETVGPLCARDWKGVGNQYVREGKCIVQSLRES